MSITWISDIFVECRQWVAA